MKPNGKQLEKLTYLIQEILKDSPHTKVYKNHKLINSKGRPREFDIVIESRLNNFPIVIAIECKEYNSPVSVEKIEAFHSKCLRFPRINRKVFISQSGYQADAFNAAEDFGIALFDLKEIDQDIILDWLPIKQLGLTWHFIVNGIYLDLKEEEIDNLQPVDQPIIIHYPTEERKPEDLTILLNNILITNYKVFLGATILEWMKHASFDIVKETPFQLGMKKTYLLSSEGQKLPLLGIEGIIETKLVAKEANILSTKAYGQTKGNAEANYFSVEMSKDVKAEVFLTKDNLQVYHTSADGTSTPLQWLWSYDRKTDTFTDISGNKDQG